MFARRSYVDRILRGAKPADLSPCDNQARFGLADVNLETAEALSAFEVPSTLLAVAGEVIDVRRLERYVAVRIR